MISLFRIFSGSRLIEQLGGLAFFQQTIVRIDRFQRSSEFTHIFGGHTSFDRLGEKLGLQIGRKRLPFANSLVSVGPNGTRPCKTSSNPAEKSLPISPPGSTLHLTLPHSVNGDNTAISSCVNVTQFSLLRSKSM